MSNYKKQARQLKKAGIIKYDLRRKLNPQQKAAITRQFKKYGEVIDKTEKFAARHLSPKNATILKNKGYKTYGRKVWIPFDDFDSVQVRRGKIVRLREDKFASLIDVEPIIKRSELLSELKRALDTKIPKGTRVTVRIGGHQKFSRMFANYADLLFYVTNVFDPKDADSNKADLINEMSLVTIIKKEINIYWRCKKCKLKFDQIESPKKCPRCKSKEFYWVEYE